MEFEACMCSSSVVSAPPEKLEFKERYQIIIWFPVTNSDYGPLHGKNPHTMALLSQLDHWVSDKNPARLNFDVIDADCSTMEVNFELVHDTKNGFLLYFFLTSAPKKW